VKLKLRRPTEFQITSAVLYPLMGAYVSPLPLVAALLCLGAIGFCYLLGCIEAPPR